MITFEVQCYENDYEEVLNPKRMQKVISNCNYEFERKVVIINKVFSRSKAEKLAQHCIDLQLIDTFYFVEDYLTAALDSFDLTTNSFSGGLTYSRSQLVGIYLCKTPYLLHFNADAYIKNRSKTKWIEDAIQQMSKDTQLICASPYWEPNKMGAKLESIRELKDWYICSGFTDNCYLIPTKLFKKCIYNEYHPDSERYPYYAGNCFKRKVNSYMKNHNLHRLVHKSIGFVHSNFQKKPVLRVLDFITYNTLQLPLRVKRYLAARKQKRLAEIREYKNKNKVYDVFNFFNELELLEVRLNILNKHVDYFVIVESTLTHSGLPKELYFNKNKKLFNKFKNKIIHLIISDPIKDFDDARHRLASSRTSKFEKDILTYALSSKNIPYDAPHFLRDFYEKEYVKKALLNLHDNDICFISDLDEIWDPEAVIDFRVDTVYKLKQDVYTYYFNNRSSEQWAGTIVTKYKNIKNSCLNHLRSKNITKHTYISKGGWHFTFQGGADRVKQKLASYSHQEFNNSNIKSKVKDRIGENKDILNRNFRYWVDSSNLPDYLIKNKAKYKKFFKKNT